MLLDRNVEQASILALNIRTRQDGRSKFYVISLALFIRLTLSCSYLFLHQMHHHGMNQNVMHCIQDQWHILTYLIKHVV